MSKSTPIPESVFITISCSATVARDPFNRTHTVQLPTRNQGVGISIRDTYGRALNDRQTCRTFGYTAETYSAQRVNDSVAGVATPGTLLTPGGIRIRKG
jgi:hypothetical protein